MTTNTKGLITRTRNLIARLADGPDRDDRLAILVKINRAGEPAIADELCAAKAAAIPVGDAARAARLADALAAARAAHRDEIRSTSWMLR